MKQLVSTNDSQCCASCSKELGAMTVMLDNGIQVHIECYAFSRKLTDSDRRFLRELGIRL
jgi:hypothetical protein